MITIKLTNKLAYTLILILAVLSISLIAYAANPATKPNPGHASNEVMVNIAGTDKTLQAAIDDGSFGGYYVPSDIKATTATHNGDFTSDASIGYDEILAWIQTNGCSGYHVCTIPEAVAYMSKTGTEVPEGWITGGGNTEYHRDGAIVLDCKAWTSNVGAADYNPQGIYYSTSAKAFSLGVCSTAMNVLCCK